jgi:hypothetical protein
MIVHLNYHVKNPIISIIIKSIINIHNYNIKNNPKIIKIYKHQPYLNYSKII